VAGVRFERHSECRGTSGVGLGLGGGGGGWGRVWRGLARVGGGSGLGGAVLGVGQYGTEVGVGERGLRMTLRRLGRSARRRRYMGLVGAWHGVIEGECWCERTDTSSLFGIVLADGICKAWG